MEKGVGGQGIYDPDSSPPGLPPLPVVPASSGPSSYLLQVALVLPSCSDRWASLVAQTVKNLPAMWET